ncbi:class I SAM-dependent methyltransferase family protein [Candidatus Woesearchaeota archaeon]|nr:MAG: class I SAM-dependent methyltransferase family protein [Candidatus Woesearchaeota archaeon]
MTLCVKVPFKDAERVKRLLERKGVLDPLHRYDKDERHIYFPITRKLEEPGLIYAKRVLPAAKKKNTLREQLRSQLTPEELAHVKSSYDIVGSIAIIEVDKALAQRERIIANAVLAMNKHVSTVLKKEGGHEGELRLQKMRCLAGKDTRETIVKENGVTLLVDVERVYYSVRSATERKRIAQLVKKGERVLVMFSGAAPYPCVIAKLAAPAHVVGIELNKRGHELGIENVRRNKLDTVTLMHGDVRELVPLLAQQGETFDRIVMPLPHTGHDFLDEALSVARTGTVVHLYDFEHEDEFEKGAEKARAGAARNGKRAEILGIVACGQHSPRVYRICVDFKVL